MEPVRILRLQVEDFMRITVVDVTLDPAATEIVVAGDNEQGKSSLLNSIATIIEGVGGVRVNGEKPTDLVRHGAKQATLRTEMGTSAGEKRYVVERSIPADKEKKPTLRIKGVNGYKVSSTQAFLSDLSGHLGLDPGDFLLMNATEQYEELSRIANIGTEIDDIDAQNDRDFEERAALNAQSKAAESAALLINVMPGLPKQRHDVEKLMDELAAATAKNAAIEKDRQARNDAIDAIARLRTQAAEATSQMSAQLDRIESKCVADIKDIDDQIAALQLKRTRVAATAVSEKQRIKVEFNERSEKLRREADDIAGNLENAAPLAEAVDTSTLENSIRTADEVNRGIADRERRSELEGEAARTKNASDELTAAMDIRKKRKREMIAESNLPVTGIGFGDKVVLLDGVPLKQASDGRQWKAACEISMAIEREIRIVLVRRASLITERNRKTIIEVAQARGFQVWFEIAATNPPDDATIVMQEGKIKC